MEFDYEKKLISELQYQKSELALQKRKIDELQDKVRDWKDEAMFLREFLKTVRNGLHRSDGKDWREEIDAVLDELEESTP